MAPLDVSDSAVLVARMPWCSFLVRSLQQISRMPLAPVDGLRAFGIQDAFVLLFTCSAVYAGPWCWTSGSQKPSFPEGCHQPTAATSLLQLDEARWQRSLWTVPFMVQPHHAVDDFKRLLALVQHDFHNFYAPRHRCPLMKLCRSSSWMGSGACR